MKKQKKNKFIPLEKILARKLKNAEFRKMFSEEMGRLRLAHEIRVLRRTRKMTQKQVATRVKTPQSVIARLESGKHGFSIATLHKVARVFNKQIGLVEPRGLKKAS